MMLDVTLTFYQWGGSQLIVLDFCFEMTDKRRKF